MVAPIAVAVPNPVLMLDKSQHIPWQQVSNTHTHTQMQMYIYSWPLKNTGVKGADLSHNQDSTYNL